MAQLLPDHTRSELRRCFSVLDVNLSGALEVDDILLFLRQKGRHDVSHDMVENAITFADSSGNGKVRLSDFVNAFLASQQRFEVPNTPKAKKKKNKTKKNKKKVKGSPPPHLNPLKHSGAMNGGGMGAQDFFAGIGDLEAELKAKGSGRRTPPHEKYMGDANTPEQPPPAYGSNPAMKLPGSMMSPSPVAHRPPRELWK